MRTLKLLVLASFISLVIWSVSPFTMVEAENGVLSESMSSAAPISNSVAQAPQEASAAFDNEPLPGDPVNPNLPDHDANLDGFSEDEDVAAGIGPVFNEVSCGRCHSVPVIGGSTQIAEVRAGRTVDNLFFDHPGDSLIHSRAINPEVQETILDLSALPGVPTRTFRMSLQLFGLGLVEAVDDNALLNIANAENAQSRALGGNVTPLHINVPILENPGQLRVGRFGWKNQMASLLSFSADAYVNEMGITTPLTGPENTSNGNSVVGYDLVPAGCVGAACITTPDDADDGDIMIFAAFMRMLKPPPRDPRLVGTPAVVRGEQLFGTTLGNSLGCSICHTPTMRTAPTGTRFVDSPFVDEDFVVTSALGNKIFHPFSDFALHNIGTGDGIVQNGGQQTKDRVRTVPLWGLRTRARLFHDGRLLTMAEAIGQHRNEAQFSANRFNALSTADKNAVIAFLRSL